MDQYSSRIKLYTLYKKGFSVQNFNNKIWNFSFFSET